MKLLLDARTHPLAFAVGVLGFVASFVLLLCSIGTNDAVAWEQFALGIREHGLFALYAKEGTFNHPPLMGLLAWFSLEASSLPAVVTARTTYQVPYYWADMNIEQTGARRAYQSVRRWPGPRGARSRVEDCGAPDRG